jgi:hypothetical protein
MRPPRPRRLLLLSALLLSPSALATDGGGWTEVSGPPMALRTRERAGSPVREVLVETELAASAWDLQQTLLQPGAFPRFMPYVKEARAEGPLGADGGQTVYNLVSLPLLGARDYVLRTYCEERVDASGAGAFRQHWRSAPDAVPRREGVSRLLVNEGHWDIRPLGPGRARVRYRFLVSPGGAIPGFAVDLANRTGVPGTLKAVEAEAQRRAAARLAAGGREPAAVLQACGPERAAAAPPAGTPAPAETAAKG